MVYADGQAFANFVPNLVLSSVLLLAGCASPGPPATPTPPPSVIEAGFNPIAKLATDMGDVYIEVFEEMVPRTAANFLGYVGSPFYLGVKVHRVVGPEECHRTRQCPEEGFMVQMGDPTTKDPSKPRSSWGQGDPALERIPDEFHPALRFDQAGVVAMANAGPDTGSSQFFITLAPTPWLNDLHAVFGRVVHGMDVVRAIGSVATVGQMPAQDIVIRATSVLAKDRSPAQVAHGVRAWTATPALNVSANRTVLLAVQAQNLGTVREAMNVSVEAPEGWTVELACPRTEPPPCLAPLDPVVPAGAPKLYLVRVTTPPGAAPQERVLPVRFASLGGNATVNVTVRVAELGAEALNGSQVLVHYVGMMLDGRVFDTSLAGVGMDASIPKFQAVFRERPSDQYQPLPFQIHERGFIEGFSLGTKGLRVGETRSVLLPPELAYGHTCPPPPEVCKAERWMVFTIELLSTSGGHVDPPMARP